MKIKNPFSCLSKFEVALWFSSIVIITVFSCFSNDIEWLCHIIFNRRNCTDFLVAKGYALGQALTIVFAVYYGIISFHFRYYGEMITYLGMTAPIAALALISWLRHPYEKTKEVEVNRLSKSQICLMLILTTAVTTAFYFILKGFNNANLFFSTVSVATSFIASYLTFFRSPYYALGYSANDIVLIILWVLAFKEDISYLPMVACFIMFLANDLYGFFNWKRMQKRQEHK